MKAGKGRDGTKKEILEHGDSVYSQCQTQDRLIDREKVKVEYGKAWFVKEEKLMGENGYLLRMVDYI